MFSIFFFHYAACNCRKLFFSYSNFFRKSLQVQFTELMVTSFLQVSGDDPYLCASFMGVKPSTNRNHLVRAILESVAFRYCSLNYLAYIFLCLYLFRSAVLNGYMDFHSLYNTLQLHWKGVLAASFFLTLYK